MALIMVGRYLLKLTNLMRKMSLFSPFIARGWQWRTCRSLNHDFLLRAQCHLTLTSKQGKARPNISEQCVKTLPDREEPGWRDGSLMIWDEVGISLYQGLHHASQAPSPFSHRHVLCSTYLRWITIKTITCSQIRTLQSYLMTHICDVSPSKP